MGRTTKIARNLGVLAIVLVLALSLMFVFFNTNTVYAQGTGAEGEGAVPEMATPTMDEDVYGYPEKVDGKQMDFVPHKPYDNKPYESWNFPATIGSGTNDQSVIREFSAGITQYAQNMDFSLFGSTVGQSNADGVTINANSIKYKTKASHMPKWWRYSFGYIALSEDLSTNGGILTMSVDTQIQYGGGEHAMYVSLVAGTGFRGEKDAVVDDTVKFTGNGKANVTDFYMNKSTGQTSERRHASNVESDMSTSETQTVSIVIKPGEKYARISFVQFYVDSLSSKTSTYIISNLRANYSLRTENLKVTAPQGQDVDSNYTGKDITFNATSANAQEVAVSVDEATGASIVKAADLCTLNVKKDGTYNVKITEKFANTTSGNLSKISTLDVNYTLPITVANCHHFNLKELNLGEGVTLVEGQNEWVDNGGEIIVEMKGKYGNSIIKPDVLNAVTINEKSNYGLKAQYGITFTPDVDVSQSLINVNLKAMDVNVIVKKNNVETFNKPQEYGKEIHFTAKVEKGETFIGWYINGMLVTAELIYTFKPTSNVILECKTIKNPAKNDVPVKFLDYAGTVIDVKYGKSVEAVIADENLKTDGKLVPNEIAFMEFVEWQASTDGFAVPVYTTTKTVEINKQVCDYNKKYTFTASEGKVFALNGQKTIEIYAIADMTLEEVADNTVENSNKPVISAEKEAKKNYNVISGIVNPRGEYREVGILIGSENLSDTDLRLDVVDNRIKAIKMVSINNGQFMINASVGKVARIYTIDNLGNIVYSDIISLPDNIPLA